MPIDYTKKKNAELEELLKARGLAHTGKKADLVARLQQHDAEQGTKPDASATATPSSTTAVAQDDVIDWEDDAAGGADQSSRPTAGATDSSKNASMNVKSDTAISTGGAETASSTAPATTTAIGTTSTVSTTDFTSGLRDTSLDDELAKRQKRAARFGLQETDAEAQKALERAKKFGIETKEVVKGLDQALPERARKRGRGEENGTGSGAAGGVKQEGKRSRVREANGGEEAKGKAGWMSEKDRLAAEARSKRFTAA